MRVTFVLPALNEAEGIERTLRRIPREQLTGAGYDVDLLVVDGDSRDGTVERARAAGGRVLVEPRRGYGRAYKSGFAGLETDFAFTGDADDSYPFEEAPRLLSEARARRLDFATVNRYGRLEPGAMSRLHQVGNFALNSTTRLLYWIQLRDCQSGMWILNRRALERLPFDRMEDGMAFSAELKIRAFRDPGLRSAELSGAYRPRLGQKKLASWRDGFKNLASLVQLRFRNTRPPEIVNLRNPPEPRL